MSKQGRTNDRWTQSIFDTFSRNGKPETMRSWPQNHIEVASTLESKYRSTTTLDTSYVQSPAHSIAQHDTRFSGPFKLMYTRFPYRDKSYLVGLFFTVGSAFLVANGFFASLSLLAPDTPIHRVTLRYVTPILSIIGTLLLWIGSNFAASEALDDCMNEHRSTEGLALEPATNLPETVNASVQIAGSNCSAVTSSSIQLSQHVLQIQGGDGSPPTYDKRTSSCSYPFLCSFLRPALQTGGTFYMALAAILSFTFSLWPTTNGDRICIKFFFPSLGGILLLSSSLLGILLCKLNISAQSKPLAQLKDNLQFRVGVWKSVGSVGFFLAGLLPWIAACSGSGGCPAGPGAFKADNGEGNWGEFWGSIAVCVGGLAFMKGGLEQWSGTLEKYS